MAFRIDHIHIKTHDPKGVADWYVGAFGFRIVTDVVRPIGDHFIVCETTEGGITVIFSGPRTGETLGASDSSAHLGLEHFAIASSEIEADVSRLEKLGARILEAPLQMRPGLVVAFLSTPGDVRIELIQRS